jgi:hypothetical protein
MLVHVMGVVTNLRKAGSLAALYNYPVLIFGFISTITSGTLSVFCAWIAVGCYSIVLRYVDEMFDSAIKGESGSKLNKTALWYAKIFTYTGNHLGRKFLTLVTVAWFISRTQILPFEHSEIVGVAGHFFAKLMFGTVVLMGMSDTESTQEELKKVE